MSASRHLHDLLAQLNKEVAVERLAEAHGIALEVEGAVYRGKCPMAGALMACVRATFARNCPGTRQRSPERRD